jgi:mono/diheme cytochrome c family protein
MRVPRRWTWLSLAGVLLACLAARATGADLSAANAPQLIKRGEYLARVGNCIGCHTADPARPFAGGRPIATRFGTIHTPNITSDPETGIGRWTDAEFLRAMHEGIGRDGKRLYPAFPYVEYTKLTDQDVLAIRAYLGAVAPVRFTPPRNDLAFPFSLRWPMVFWNLLNFTEGRFVPDPKASAERNRGAYLVEGLAHCGECHTPRNLTHGLNASERLGGGTVAGWHAYNITPDKNAGIGAWSVGDITAYLSTGAAPGRANAAGPMAEVVSNGTQYLTQEDLRSVAAYLRSLPAVSDGATRPRANFDPPVRDDVTALRGSPAGALDGARLFIGNCASCHGLSGEGAGLYPPLRGNSASGANPADNLALLILNGVRRSTQRAAVFMPAFAGQLSDAQIAAISNYVTNRFGNRQASMNAERVAKLRATPQ